MISAIAIPRPVRLAAFLAAAIAPVIQDGEIELARKGKLQPWP
jgi:hypothetical protein